MSCGLGVRGVLTGAWRGGSRDGLAGWRITFEFDQDVVDALKLTIPAGDRECNEEHKYRAQVSLF